MENQIKSEIRIANSKYLFLYMGKLYFNHRPDSISFASIHLQTMKMSLNKLRSNSAQSFIDFHLVLEHTDAKVILARYITLDNWSEFKNLMDSHVEFMSTYRQIHADKISQKIA